ncbi:MAG: UDP-N-acetylmuramate dehydrogenase [Lachnospiraceae bacterium]|nr:UDP-N-acetylmuramate dehydrogenase [Lachnospiraceae bacterium]
MEESRIRLIRRFLDVDGMIKLNEPLSLHTSFGVGGPAEVFLSVSRGELMRLVPFLYKNNEPFTLLGNGSNVLVSDKGLPGLVLCIADRMSEIEVKGKTIRVQAGALLPRVAQIAAQNGLGGLEFASGIPGTIGGATVMNAGAYGGEMKDVIKSVNVILSKGGIRIHKTGDCEFGYRTSRFLGNNEEIITDITFELEEKDEEEINEKMNEFRAKRSSSQPIDKRSAGSTFKRVAADNDETALAEDRRPAWQLVDAAGCKGLTLGGAKVSEKHCGFVINDGGASASDIYRLIETVKERVKENSGVELTCEIRMLGDFS